MVGLVGGSVVDHQDAERRRLAVARTREACTALAEMGVTVQVIGSLASGQFSAGSDIDLLVRECPRHLKYAIEGIVEDYLGGFSFDVVYLEEIPAEKLARFTQGAVDARHLG